EAIRPLRKELEKDKDELQRTSHECMTLIEEVLLEKYTPVSKMEAQCDQFEAMIDLQIYVFME
ncbi:unnamed protein product, partial [Acanthocheilonema viteae]